MTKGCISCDIKEKAREMDVAALIAEQLSMETNLVDESTYVQRVAKCENCVARSLHTCTKCGCFYAFRARISIKSCPVGHW